MGKRNIDIAVGLFVVAGIASLLILAMQVSNLSAFSEDEGYQLTARFDNIGGLKVRSPVAIGGVKVGRVVAIHLDPKSYQAVVTVQIGKDKQLPTDSSASIFTSGLLGEQYIGLDAGGESQFLADGGEIKLTQSAVVLEQLIGQMLFSKAAEGTQ